MRDDRLIEREIDEVRADLEARLGALRESLEAKLDVSARVRDASRHELQRLRRDPTRGVVALLFVVGFVLAIFGRRGRRFIIR